MAKTLYKPGMDNKPAGRYREVGPCGGAVFGRRLRIHGETPHPRRAPCKRYGPKAAWPRQWMVLMRAPARQVTDKRRA